QSDGKDCGPNRADCTSSRPALMTARQSELLLSCAKRSSAGNTQYDRFTTGPSRLSAAPNPREPGNSVGPYRVVTISKRATASIILCASVRCSSAPQSEAASNKAQAMRMLPSDASSISDTCGCDAGSQAQANRSSPRIQRLVLVQDQIRSKLRRSCVRTAM